MSRAFIVGNGPSLLETPLEKLQGETTFVMNRIHLLWRPNRIDHTFPHPKWTPTYYVAMDVSGPHMPMDAKMGAKLSEKSIMRPDRVGDLGPTTVEWPPKQLFIQPCFLHVASNITTPEKIPESWHFPQMCAFGGTLGIAIQLAASMGHNPIYLIGCDLGFTPEDMDTHFDHDYHTFDDFPLEYRDATLVRMHEIARDSANAMGTKIYNATVGGLLEVYPRVDINEVLDG